MITYESLPKDRSIRVAPRDYATYDTDHFKIVHYADISKKHSGRIIATLTPEFTRVNFSGPASTLKKLFDLNVKQAPFKTAHISGYTHRWSLGGRDNKQNAIYGSAPIIIINEKLYSLNKPLSMVVNTEKKREVDRMLNSIKKMVTVRDKLGAFSSQLENISKVDVTQDIVKDHIKYGSHIERVYAVLCNTRPESLDSFTPLLYMSQYLKRMDDNWRDAVNHLLNIKRQALYLHTGAITFTPTQPSTIEEILNGAYKSVELLSTDGV